MDGVMHALVGVRELVCREAFVGWMLGFPATLLVLRLFIGRV